ncbi:MAG: D-glycero-beta-D-manno-heptose 1-phosphate adenylyltransferase [Planctomycetota bacterium]
MIAAQALTAAALDRLGSPRILVVGDLMLDEYVWGSVGRISPEAPVPVVAAHHLEIKVGGAGSVVANLAMLGAPVEVCGLVGDDESGRKLVELLAQLGVPLGGVVASTERRTTRKTRVMASVQQAHRAQQQVCRIDWEDSAAPSARELARIDVALDQAFSHAPAAVLVSDYEKGFLSEPVVARVIGQARQRRIPVLVDPGRSVTYNRYRGATLICPNRFEAQHASGIELRSPADFLAAGEKLLRELELEHVALTLDREGIFLCSRAGGHQHFPTRARAVTDVAGAGDMVLSLLGLALASAWNVADAVQLANAGAGVEVSKVGVTPIERWEIAEALSAHASGEYSKVRGEDEARRIVERARAQGQQVVFTNGCFDVLHSGHIALLQKARALGDILVVGLNSDASIRRLKGSDRPVNTQDRRGRVLSSISAIDHVVVFDDDTPIELIRRLAPNVLVKGADYVNKTVVGRELVEARGGKVVLVELEPDLSTTAILSRLRSREGG